MEQNSNYISIDDCADIKYDITAVGAADCDSTSDELECKSTKLLEVEPDLIDIKYGTNEDNDDYQTIKVEVDIHESSQNDAYDNTLDYFNQSLVDEYASKSEEIIEVIIKSEGADESDFESDTELQAYVCYKCGRSYTRKSSLNRHMDSHLKAKVKREKLVKTKLKQSSKYNSSTNQVRRRENEICHICGKCFQHQNLKSHMNVHSKDKHHKCEICLKEFNFKNNLQRHMLLHQKGTPYRPFKCNICEKSFTRKEHLNKHMFSHTNEMPHQCMLCNKLFKYKDSLRMHLKYHSGEKRFRCEICGNGFIRRDNLQAHLRTVHIDDKVCKCDICKREFLEKDAYIEHLKLHTSRQHYRCETCGKLCRTKQTLASHRNTHLAEKPFKCKICEHTFSQKGTLNLHIRTHTGEKPYTCFVCSRSFTQKATLRSHVQRHRKHNGRYIKVESPMP